ncbi:MAG: DNA repair protein RadC [Chitinophagaceae bacterium]
MENIHTIANSIKNWAEDDRPREKLVQKGPAALSNSELLAILINNGTRNKSAIDLAKEILKLGKDNLNELGKQGVKDFQKVKGIGTAKAVTIAAALEIGRRRQGAEALEKPSMTSSRTIAQYLQSILQDEIKEVFVVLFLNAANKINGYQIISSGGITGTVADPRIIIKKALEENATRIVLSHNHPSGSTRPSEADISLTKKIKEASGLMDIQVLDHIIIGNDKYYSFADEGLM